MAYYKDVMKRGKFIRSKIIELTRKKVCNALQPNF